MRPPHRVAAVLTLRTAVTFAAAMAAALVFVEIAERVVEGTAETFDAPVARAIRRIDGPLLDAAMIAITHAGGWLFLSVMIAVTAAFAARHRRWRAVWVLIANDVVAVALDQLLKALFARPRPELASGIPLPESYSFPSGHALGALAVYGAIAAVVIELVPRARTAALAVVVPLVLAIGLSRVYLGVHWPTDVLAGFAAAVPLLAATELLLRAAPREADGRGGVSPRARPAT